MSQKYLGGETLHGLSRRHDFSRNPIRIWVEKRQAGGLDEDVAAADLFQVYEASIAALDFVEARTNDGRKFRMLNVVDEFTRECLPIRAAHKHKAINVIDVLSYLFILRGVPAHIRSDNGPEFIVKSMQPWIASVGAKTAYIAPGSPWENGYVESLNARVRDELLNGEIFYTLKEAQIMTESCDDSTILSGPTARLATARRPGSVRSSHDRLAGCAHPTGSAGQANRGEKADPALTFDPDYPVGEDQVPVVTSSAMTIPTPVRTAERRRFRAHTKLNIFLSAVEIYGHPKRFALIFASLVMLLSSHASAFDSSKADQYPSYDMNAPEMNRFTVHDPSSAGELSSTCVKAAGSTFCRSLQSNASDAVNVGMFGADATGATSARAAIVTAMNYADSKFTAASDRLATWQGEAPGVFLPPGEYLWDGPAYNPPGVGPILIQAIPGTVRIRNTGGDYLLAPSGIVTQTDIRGLHVLGGKGLIHYTYASANVTGQHVIEDNVLDGFTECGICNESPDNPLYSIVRNTFYPDPSATTARIGVALGGYQDDSVIAQNQFYSCAIGIKIGDRLSGSFKIRDNDFLDFKGGTLAIADIWVVPNSTDAYGNNSGFGGIIRDNRFGNENLNPAKPNILIAVEGAGASRAVRLPSSADSTSAYVSGLIIDANRFEVIASMTAPLLKSNISNLRSFVFTRANVVKGGRTYLAQMPASSAVQDYSVRNWSIDLGPAPDVGTLFQFGISNVPVGMARDEWGVQQTDPMARIEGPADDASTVLLAGVSGSGLSAESGATVTATTDLYGGSAAALVTAADTGASHVYAALSSVTPDRMTWLELVLAQAPSRTVASVMVEVYSYATQARAMRRQVTLPVGATTVRIPFIVPPGSAPTTWLATVIPTSVTAGTADRFVIHRLRAYHARTPVQSGHLRTLGSGAWSGEHLILGPNHLWVDASGRLRIKSGTPTSDADGAIVGTQQ